MPKPVYELKAQFFKTLGHPVRIRVLELLVDGPRSVSALQGEIGIESSHLSQHLAVLRRAGVVASTRRGSSVIYEVIDPAVFELLQVARRVIVGRLERSREMIDDLESLDY